MTTCIITHPVINPQALLFIDLHASAMTFDPAGSTLELFIGSTSYALTWIGVAIQAPDGTWDQYARTSVRFSGSLVIPVPPDVALPVGRYWGTVIITTATGQRVPIEPKPIDIK